MKIVLGRTPEDERLLRNEEMCETRQVTAPVWSYQDFKTKKVWWNQEWGRVVDLRLVIGQKWACRSVWRSWELKCKWVWTETIYEESDRKSNFPYPGLSEKGHLLAHITRLCFGLTWGMPWLKALKMTWDLVCTFPSWKPDLQSCSPTSSPPPTHPQGRMATAAQACYAVLWCVC